jgi:hypothetical protein
VIIQADARDPRSILQQPDAQRLLDLSRPLGVLLIALLHFIPDDAAAAQLMRTLQDCIAPGSYVAVSHALSEPTAALTPEGLSASTQVYRQSDSPFAARAREHIAHLLAGLELVKPGLVYVPLWRPEGPDDVFLQEPERSAMLAAVGRKPA